MVGTLIPGLIGLGLNPGQEHCVVLQYLSLHPGA